MGNSKSKTKRVVTPAPVSNPIINFYRRSGSVSTENNSHPKSKNKIKPRDRIPPKIRDSVWIAYHGNKTSGICYCCGLPIQRYNAGWHCSHVISDDKKGPTTLDNLRTCCPHCNLSMGNCNLYVYIDKKKLKGPGSRNAKLYFQRHPSQINDKRTNNWGK